jgi:hypothetical protein
MEIKHTGKRCEEVYTTDNSIMKAIANSETELKLSGLKITVTLAVVESLGYDLIIGMDVMR